MARVIRLERPAAEETLDVATRDQPADVANAQATERATDDPRPIARRGWLILVFYFGMLGAFAALAPLGGAVVASGYFKSEGNRRTVQHPDGGIVAFLGVREGDHVRAGTILLKLDATEVKAELAVIEQHYLALRMTQARVTAELTGAQTLSFPAEIASHRSDPEVAALWQAQLRQFETRGRSLDGRRAVIRDRIAQVEAGMKGTERQLETRRIQLASVTRERDGLLPLVDQGIVTRPRITALDRSIAQLEGEIADLAAAIAKAHENIAEQRQTSEQIGYDRSAELAQELRETQARLVEVLPRLTSARARAERLTMRASASGRVVGLSVFATGAVVAKGEKILDIVPDDDALVVEARIPVEQSADVRVGAPAEVHLTALRDGAPPIVSGTVVHVSADRITDNPNGPPHFEVVVRVDDGKVGPAAGLNVHAGMPAMIVVPTIARTALRYIMDPLARAWSGALREK